MNQPPDSKPKRIIPGYKDENGVYTPIPRSTPTPAVEETIMKDISIDDLLNRGLHDIYGVMRALRKDINGGAPSRETVQNLKDCMAMLSDLKKKEKEFLDTLTDEELEKFAK